MTSPQSVAIPLFAPLANRDASILKDSRLINGFAEKGQGEDGKEVWVYKRAGLHKLATYGPGAGLGIFNWQGDIYAVFGTLLYKNGVSLGTVDASSSYTFTSCLGATPKLFLKNKTHAYNYDSGAGLVAVVDVDYPAFTVRGCEYLDGTTYVMDEKSNIDGDDFNNPTSWDPLNKIVAQIEPDRSQCLAKQLVYIVAIKTVSTEIFYDAGNATGSPLSSVQGSKLGYGTVAPESVVRCGDDLAWLSTTTEGAVQVMFMEKVHGEVVSTPPVERLLSSFTFSVVYAFAIRISGHRFYIVTMKANNTTLVFDLSNNLWYIWTDSNGNYFPIVSATYSGEGSTILQHESDGSIYTLDPGRFQDEGVNFTVSLFTPNFDGGLRTTKTCSSIDLVADETNTEVQVSWSNDDYQTFTTPQSVNLNQERPLVVDGSSFRKRAFKITHADNTFLRLKALNVISSAGTF